MREFDHNGLLLCEYQGKLFEKSVELNCSSPVFIRRFFYSEELEYLDDNNSAWISLDVCEGIRNIEKQFGKFNYGKNKYSKDTMFWMGYMYRYISYTRDVSTRVIMKLFNHKLMNEVFYSFHTQSPEWCVRSLLEINNLTEDIFDINYRFKKALKESEYYQNLDNNDSQ